MALIDYNNGTATISINGGQPPFSYLLLQNGTAVNYSGANFQNPVVSPNNSVIFGNSSDTSGTYGLPSGTYTCQVTDNAGCVTNTPAIVIGQTQEATTTTIATTTSTTLLQEYTSLTVDQSPVNEGLNILFTLESSNIPNGSMVDWDITGGITSDDISGGLAGSFTIQNNQAQYLATIESDEILEGQEQFTLRLAAIDTNGVAAGLSVDVIINDMNTAATTTTTLATTTLPTTTTTLATTTLATTTTTLATTTLATTTTTLATTTTDAPTPQHFNWVVSTDAAATNRINPVLEDQSTEPTCWNTPNVQYWYYPLQAGGTYYWHVEPTLTTSRIQLQMQSGHSAYAYQIAQDNFLQYNGGTPCNNNAGSGNGNSVTQKWLEDVGGIYGPAGNEVEGVAPYFVTDYNDTISNYYKFTVPANAEDTSEFAYAGLSGSYSFNGTGGANYNDNYDTQYPFDNDEFSPLGFLVNFRILAPATTTLATTTIAPAEYDLFTAYLNRDEGQSAFFELQYNNVTPGTTVGFTLSGTATPAQEFGGMIEPMDYTEPTDMFFTTGTSGFVILEIPINEDQQTEGTETIILTLDAQDSDGNPTGSLQKTVTINDTSELQNWEIAASTHDEGITFNHILNTEHAPAGTEYFWYASVAIGYPWTAASAADFVGGVVPSGSGTIPAYNETLSQSAVIPVSIVADSLTEGDEVYQIIVKEGTPSNPGTLRVIQMMTITDSSSATTTLPTTTTTLATTTLPTFTCGDANFTVNTGVVGTGVSATSTGVPTLIVPAHYVLGVNSYTATITVPATDAWGTAYSNAGGSIECSAVGVGIVATTLATTAAPLNRTFYYIHAGQSTTPYTSSLTGGGPFYINGGNGTSNDLNVAMQDMIANSGNQYYGLVESFDMPQGVNITGNENATTWSYPQTSAAEPYYIAVPDNADFPENLMAGGLLTNLANNQPANAGSFASFTDANGNDYKLYQLAASSSTGSSNWAFV